MLNLIPFASLGDLLRRVFLFKSDFSLEYSIRFSLVEQGLCKPSSFFEQDRYFYHYNPRLVLLLSTPVAILKILRLIGSSLVWYSYSSI